MTKLAVRVKRRFSRLRGRNRSSRPKTFGTEDAAKKWATEHGVETYSLVKLQKDKIRIEQE